MSQWRLDLFPLTGALKIRVITVFSKNLDFHFLKYTQRLHAAIPMLLLWLFPYIQVLTKFKIDFNFCED